MFLADKQPSSGLVLNTYDIVEIFEDLDQYGLLKGKEYLPEKVEPDTRKVINLTRLSTFIIKPPHGEYQVYPNFTHLAFDEIVTWLKEFPITTECWVLYDAVPATVMFEQHQTVLNNTPRYIDIILSDLTPICNSHDIVKGFVKIIRHEVKDIVDAFIDDVYWQLIEDHTNILTNVKKTDSVENILEKYLQIPSTKDASWRLYKELLGLIYRHEDAIVQDLIKDDKDMIYLNQSIGNFQQLITKYNIDYRVAAYELYFQNLDEGTEDEKKENA